MTTDFVMVAYKDHISRMMKYLRNNLHSGVEWINAPNIRPFETMYCNVDGNLFGVRDGGTIPVKPTPELYQAVHASLTRQCKQKMDVVSGFSNVKYLATLLKGYYRIAFIDL